LAAKKYLRTRRHRALIEVMVEARQAAGLSQRALAAKLGLPDDYVWKFEAGERRLQTLEFVEWAHALGLKATELMERLERRL
jgi:transcriptional regulator with XRE-family HTH domain